MVQDAIYKRRVSSCFWPTPLNDCPSCPPLECRPPIKFKRNSRIHIPQGCWPISKLCAMHRPPSALGPALKSLTFRLATFSAFHSSCPGFEPRHRPGINVLLGSVSLPVSRPGVKSQSSRLARNLAWSDDIGSLGRHSEHLHVCSQCTGTSDNFLIKAFSPRSLSKRLVQTPDHLLCTVETAYMVGSVTRFYIR